MNTDIDIAMSARMLIDRHGENAAMIAAQGEYEMRERGDEKGAAIWKRIIDAVADAKQENTVRFD